MKLNIITFHLYPSFLCSITLHRSITLESVNFFKLLLVRGRNIVLKVLIINLLLCQNFRTWLELSCYTSDPLSYSYNFIIIQFVYFYINIELSLMQLCLSSKKSLLCSRNWIQFLGNLSLQ